MCCPEPEIRLRRREFVPVGSYKIVMALSLLVNLLLAACLWNYTTSYNVWARRPEVRPMGSSNKKGGLKRRMVSSISGQRHSSKEAC